MGARRRATPSPAITPRTVPPPTAHNLYCAGSPSPRECATPMTDIRPPQDSIVSGAFWGRNPHGELRWLRENDPVYWDEDGGVWGVTKYDHIKEIESDPATFSNAGGIRP